MGSLLSLPDGRAPQVRTLTVQRVRVHLLDGCVDAEHAIRHANLWCEGGTGLIDDDDDDESEPKLPPDVAIRNVVSLQLVEPEAGNWLLTYSDLVELVVG